ncbi:Putative N2,N2-dimethylguanosine tRNA methyltransferase [Plasmopara halstedii]|uniref:Putative N2,N2-dimethylguanosine tRNA methyltransferase n=1 Tax=Plasmopara halstedii TaxID=4781 RepID=A0A0P1AWZ2_PLAHL|nr:Putative N2,N2-dimethylguanosine tRNA methyltransferase [Plasmopara halstedii]CEG45801.1 Putative N2,N2-dimethylguanosine tRNA methyltransferase [Plasmopara halstedii]|eukprot:XP_024582170.1 Putative N2,N2-dimethylguanosine tRNA methyltransferase [Plasmopara halstedii]
MTLSNKRTKQRKHEAFFRLNSDTCIQVVQDTSKVDGMGGEVWAGALILCEFLTKHNKNVVHGREVIELGAGCGLCGLVAASLGAKLVVLTDEYPDLLAENILRNRHIWAEREANASPIASCRRLEWGAANSFTSFEQKFDTMLGSEITQLGRILHAPLLEAIRIVLRPGPDSVAFLSMDMCQASCEGTCDVSKCTASHFVAVAKQTGFTVYKHSSVHLASHKAVTTLVGALGRRLKVDQDDWSTVYELRFGDTI